MNFFYIVRFRMKRFVYDLQDLHPVNSVKRRWKVMSAWVDSLPPRVQLIFYSSVFVLSVLIAFYWFYQLFKVIESVVL